MVELLEETKENLIATRIKGKVTSEDYDFLLPMIDEIAEKYGKVKWYYEVEDLEGWELYSLWEQAKFELKHLNDFKKIAIVGDKNWEEIASDIVKPILLGEIRYYDLADKEEALEWIQDKKD